MLTNAGSRGARYLCVANNASLITLLATTKSNRLQQYHRNPIRIRYEGEAPSESSKHPWLVHNAQQKVAARYKSTVSEEGILDAPSISKDESLPQAPEGEHRKDLPSTAVPPPSPSSVAITDNITPGSDSAPSDISHPFGRLDQDGNLLFTKGQRYLFHQVNSVITHKGPHRRTPALVLYRYAVKLLDPNIKTGLPDLGDDAFTDAERERACVDELSVDGQAKTGELSIPLWAKLVKTAQLAQDGFAFRVIVKRLLAWCNLFNQEATIDGTHAIRGLEQIDVEDENVQTLAQMRQLLTAALVKMRSRGALGADDHIDVSVLFEVDPTPLSDLDSISAFEIAAIARASAPPSNKQAWNRVQRNSIYNWGHGAGALTLLDQPSLEAQAQAEELLKLLRMCDREQDLQWPTLVRMYRQNKGLKWQPGSLGLDAEKHDLTAEDYFNPFKYLGTPEDPFSACSVMINKERLLRWAKRRYRLEDSTTEAISEDVSAERSLKLTVPTWLFVAILTSLSETGRTASIRSLIQTYLKVYSQELKATGQQVPKYHPNPTNIEALKDDRTVIPASVLLNLLVKSHIARGSATGETEGAVRGDGGKYESDSARMDAAWRDICLFCLTKEDQIKAQRIPNDVVTDEVMSSPELGLPLLSPDEGTIINLLNMLPKGNSSAHLSFGIVNLSEKFFGLRCPASVADQDWSGLRVRNRKGFQHVNHPALEDPPSDRPYLIYFSNAILRRLMTRAHWYQSPLLCQTALVLSRRWKLEEYTRSLEAKVDFHLEFWEDHIPRIRQRHSTFVENQSQAQQILLESSEKIFANESETKEYLGQNLVSVPIEDFRTILFNIYSNNPHLVSTRTNRRHAKELGHWYNSIRAAYKKRLFWPFIKGEPVELQEIEKELHQLGDSVDHQLDLQKRTWARAAGHRAGKRLLRQIGASRY
ncbi:unnamed protein product [Sympodiomycopsis kandeliae]